MKVNITKHAIIVDRVEILSIFIRYPLPDQFEQIYCNMEEYFADFIHKLPDNKYISNISASRYEHLFVYSSADINENSKVDYRLTTIYTSGLQMFLREFHKAHDIYQL